MFLLSAVLLLILSLQQINLHNFSAVLTLPFHMECVRFAPEGNWRELYQATVCGKSFQDPTLLPLLKKFGLLHLIVVSGAHLVFLERLMHMIGLRAKFFSYFVMCFFLLITQAQPPLVRALLGMILQDVSEQFHFFWRPSQTLWISGLLTWVLFPEWIHSYSFLLSWCCSLVLVMTTGLKNLGPIKRECVMYFFMGLFLLPLQTPHPVSILLNFIFAPLVGFLLFPSSLFAFLIPPLTIGIDRLWDLFAKGLVLLDQSVPAASIQQPVSLLILWSFLWSLHFFEELRQRRKATL